MGSVCIRFHSRTNQSDKSFGRAHSFFGFCDGDQLVPRGLCSTVPRLIEIRHGGAGSEQRQRWFVRGTAGGEARGAPDSLEYCCAAALQFFARGNDVLHFVGEGVDVRICVLPGLDERLRIESADEFANLVQLEQFGRRWNQQTDPQLNRSNRFNQIEAL